MWSSRDVTTWAITFNPPRTVVAMSMRSKLKKALRRLRRHLRAMKSLRAEIESILRDDVDRVFETPDRTRGLFDSRYGQTFGQYVGGDDNDSRSYWMMRFGKDDMDNVLFLCPNMDLVVSVESEDDFENTDERFHLVRLGDPNTDGHPTLHGHWWLSDDDMEGENEIYLDSEETKISSECVQQEIWIRRRNLTTIPSTLAPDLYFDRRFWIARTDVRSVRFIEFSSIRAKSLGPYLVFDWSAAPMRCEENVQFPTPPTVRYAIDNIIAPCTNFGKDRSDRSAKVRRNEYLLLNPNLRVEVTHDAYRCNFCDLCENQRHASWRIEFYEVDDEQPCATFDVGVVCGSRFLIGYRAMRHLFDDSSIMWRNVDELVRNSDLTRLLDMLYDRTHRNATSALKTYMESWIETR